MIKSPVIGVTTYRERAIYGQWDNVAVLLPEAYVSSIRAAGGVPVLLPPEFGTGIELIERLDGLVLAGGADVSPDRYNAARDEATGEARLDRDSFELEMIQLAWERALPTLAICRGLQILNVARGGTLLQHLPDSLGHEEHDPVKGGFGSHGVRLQPGTRLAKAIGASVDSVPTHHHQAIDSLGVGLVATGWSEDGTIEAIEDPSQEFLLGVQWHPEVMDEPDLFRALVRAGQRAL
ncbi:MAG: gamma-glutamyl-gamma-aminobutyrate hydrolase family protein [Ferrimicrobium sp.]